MVTVTVTTRRMFRTRLDGAELLAYTPYLPTDDLPITDGCCTRLILRRFCHWKISVGGDSVVSVWLCVWVCVWIIVPHTFLLFHATHGERASQTDRQKYPTRSTPSQGMDACTAALAPADDLPAMCSQGTAMSRMELRDTLRCTLQEFDRSGSGCKVRRFYLCVPVCPERSIALCDVSLAVNDREHGNEERRGI